ncbi:protein-glutamate methylesterase CheB [Synechococcus sp. PCC 7335]|uniref:chemotaxis protein CheB n=1 Tax=Synechococcus sp. (strain ATCC 29403 / PCC 7335) TaxID=91464 RepID=UPI00017EDD0F|nr:chemotaxis protein CheB [Synechococcus sp. PCC 7335]EDX84660.1 protein-glutamate methylesterase CheB [Synechococcus sp. PCC 7335]
MLPHRVVVVGASAGGVAALRNLFSQFSHDIQAAFIVVLHILAESPSVLPTLLDNAGPLKAKAAEDNEPILPGHVYVAPPDFHLLVKPGFLRLHRGPKENRHRPAIDPMFRSAAIAYPGQTIGVVLTGYLDDGTAGLSAIKRCGGFAIVQDPQDADFPDMPMNALAEVDVDYKLPLHQIGGKITQLVIQAASDTHEVPKDIVMEAKIAEQTVSDIRREDLLGHQVPMNCPDCNGPLWQMEGGTVKRYRCHVGHSFTARTLMASQDSVLEKALWVAMRTMEERANLSLLMAKNEAKQQRDLSAQLYAEQSETLKAHAQVIRQLLVESTTSSKSIPSTSNHISSNSSYVSSS